jgi:hypothetical protein
VATQSGLLVDVLGPTTLHSQFASNRDVNLVYQGLVSGNDRAREEASSKVNHTLIPIPIRKDEAADFGE